MSEEEAEDAFVALRYVENDGHPFCHRCGCAVAYRLNRSVKNRKTGAVRMRRLFKCANCLRQFSATSGTIFASRKLEHRDILFAIGLFANGLNGKAGLQLSRDLKVQFKTAFVLEHKLREALGAVQHLDQLGGDKEVEIDGAYFGGKQRKINDRKNQPDLRMLENRSPRRRCVVIMRERNGRSRPFVCSELEGAKLAEEIIVPRSRVYADESKAFDSLDATFDIKRITHANFFATGEISTNWAESYYSRMRRMERGVHLHFSPQHLGQYANEGSWREDHRRLSNGDQFLLITAAGLHHPVSNRWKGYWQRRKAA